MPRIRDQRANNVDVYRRNREREHARIRIRQAGQLELLRDLRRRPCQACGGLFEPHQMDFDHRNPAEKSFELTKGRAMLMATAKIMAEVAKCDIVCANCHRTRTQRRADEFWATAPRRGTSRYIERSRRYWRGHMEMLRKLRSVPCLDCGGSFEWCVMEFDHRDPATKAEAVTRMVGLASVERILAEVAKCDVVCANCHRMRTFRRRGPVYAERE
jgi:formate-dependent nitrite reductase cytochrome c552 subunit